MSEGVGFRGSCRYVQVWREDRADRPSSNPTPQRIPGNPQLPVWVCSKWKGRKSAEVEEVRGRKLRGDKSGLRHTLCIHPLTKNTLYSHLTASLIHFSHPSFGAEDMSISFWCPTASRSGQQLDFIHMKFKVILICRLWLHVIPCNPRLTPWRWH